MQPAFGRGKLGSFLEVAKRFERRCTRGSHHSNVYAAKSRKLNWCSVYVEVDGVVNVVLWRVHEITG